MAKNPLTLDQIAQGWVDEGGDPKWAVPMAKIALRESGGRVDINNRGLNKNGTVDWGLYQVNDVWRHDPVVGPLFKSGEILTQQGATKAAIRIFKVQGPKAWATYNPATDQKYLGRTFSPSGSSSPSGTGTGGSGQPPGVSLPTPGAQPDLGQASDFTGLLSSLLAKPQPQPVQSMGIQAPSFAAAPPLPQGFHGLLATAVPAASRPSVDDALGLINALGAQGGSAVMPTPSVNGSTSASAPVSNTGASQSPSNASRGTKTPTGKVTIAAGANRAGAKINPAVVDFVSGVAGRYGAPLTIGTGTNHNRLTINGTVSDHWSGNGADIPLTGRALIKAGQDALIQAGMSPAKARQQTGGGYNVGDWQIIFNTDAPGWGDHTTHLHVGRRVR